jgi:putative flavoprotein involved in K+ transport
VSTKPVSLAVRGARAVDVIVIGAGHSGLAMSQCLSRHGIDHVVLERGEIANSWRHERWDSLRLLTPNWQVNLPGHEYAGPDPDGFMAMREVIDFIDAYAARISAPVRTDTTVTRVSHDAARYRIETTRGNWTSRAVVIANGAFNTPVIPACSESLPRGVDRLASQQYRNPEQLRDEAVLIVGASATGLQLANEIQRSGRSVTLAVGEHIRMPRRYRGRDIQWWMHSAGVLDQLYTEVEDIGRARRVPSPGLIGSDEHAILDLNALQQIGVRIVGRLVGADGDKAQFSGSLANQCAMADLKLNRLLNAFDEWADSVEVPDELAEPERFASTQVDNAPPSSLRFSDENIGTVLWATGLRPAYRWLDLPVFDRRNRIQHDGGVLPVPGSYVMGLPFMRRRKSSYMHGAADDAQDLSSHLADYLRSNKRFKWRRTCRAQKPATVSPAGIVV